MRQYNIVSAECYRNFPGLSSATQVIRDVGALYGALQIVCKRVVPKNILLKYEKTSNGVAV